jgi:hypothetical protein
MRASSLGVRMPAATMASLIRRTACRLEPCVIAGVSSAPFCDDRLTGVFAARFIALTIRHCNVTIKRIRLVAVTARSSHNALA